MRRLTTFLLAMMPLFAQTAEEKDALAAVQKVFAGMAAHDSTLIRSVMLPTARLYSVRDDAAPGDSTGEAFATQIGSLQGDLLERFTGRPDVSIHGRMAVITGEYEFLRDGKFGHCGTDSFSLFKTAEGWKIAAIVFTMETTGCQHQP